jgi:hypothetical protein
VPEDTNKVAPATTMVFGRAWHRVELYGDPDTDLIVPFEYEVKARS